MLTDDNGLVGLKERRKAAGMTVEALSEASGVPIRTIFHWERNGTGRATVESLKKVADALNVDIGDLVTKGESDEVAS